MTAPLINSHTYFQNNRGAILLVEVTSGIELSRNIRKSNRLTELELASSTECNTYNYSRRIINSITTGEERVNASNEMNQFASLQGNKPLIRLTN